MSESNLNLTMNQFPLLAAAARNQQRFEAALADVLAGVRDGAIRNVVLDDAKHTLSKAVSDGYRKYVGDPFFAGKGGKLAQAVHDLHWDVRVHGLHDLIAASKKLAKTKVTGPEVNAMREFVNQGLPLALAVASLKSKVIKGRAPSTGPSKPENPNKDVKTCPCCFRSIAVVGGKEAGGVGNMAHHGYERPGDGYQTQSCPGVRFQALDVSTDGLVWMIDMRKETLKGRRATLKKRDEWETVPGRDDNGRPALIKKGEKRWDYYHRAFVSQLEGEISWLERELPRLKNVLTTWKPGPQKLAF